MIKSGKIVDGTYTFNADSEITLTIQDSVMVITSDKQYRVFILAEKIVMSTEHIYIIDMRYNTIIKLDDCVDHCISLIHPRTARNAFGVKTLEPVIVLPRKSTDDTVIYNLSGNIIKTGEYMPQEVIEVGDDIVVNIDKKVYRVDNFKLVYLFAAASVYPQIDPTDYLYCKGLSVFNVEVLRIRPHPMRILNQLFGHPVISASPCKVMTQVKNGHAYVYNYSAACQKYEYVKFEYHNYINMRHIPCIYNSFYKTIKLKPVHLNPLNPPLPIVTGRYLDVTFILTAEN